MPSRSVHSRSVTLTGWGRVAPSRAELAEPSSPAEAAVLLDAVLPRNGAQARGVIARGLGRSYNNAAQCGGGLVISTARLNRIISLDPATGLACCEAGVSLEQLMVAGLASGWFVPVTPGTRHATIGGAIAADVHGKNHFAEGSFAQHVTGFAPAAARWRAAHGHAGRRPGAVLGHGRRDGPHRPDHQRHRSAQAGGERPWSRCTPVRTAGLAETMAVLAEHDTSYSYTLAWVGQPGPGRPPGPLGDHQRGLRPPGRPACGPPGQRAGVRAAHPDRRSRRVPARADQPVHRGAGQHGLVSQGAARSAATSCRRSRTFFHPLDGIEELEPGLRPGRLPAVPVRRPRGPGGCCPRKLTGWSARPRAALVRDGTQAPGGAGPRPAVVPDRGVDAGARRARTAPPGLAGLLARLDDRWPGPAAGSTWRRTRGCQPGWRPGCIPAWTGSASCGPGWTRRACWPRTCPGGSGCGPLRHRRILTAGGAAGAGPDQQGGGPGGGGRRQGDQPGQLIPPGELGDVRGQQDGPAGDPEQQAGQRGLADGGPEAPGQCEHCACEAEQYA